jgi:hypothetical protein
VAISAGTGVAAGDCLMITDGTNTDYFTAISGTTDTSLVVPTLAIHNYAAITHNYTIADGARIQLLREQDPEGEPSSWYDSVDSVVRYGIKVIVNEIDYSS